MESYYLIDFENVHNEGITNIENMTKSDHVHIFSTQNAINIRPDIFWLNGDITSHLVPVRKQSLDMHLVSFLGYLLGIHGKGCSYLIISKDKDYDNIIKFWKDQGYPNIFRQKSFSGKIIQTAQTANKAIVTTKGKQAQKINSVISPCLSYPLSRSDRQQLNLYVQHALTDDYNYTIEVANRVCKYVIAHCNDEHMLNGVHNDIRVDFPSCYEKLYSDVKKILSEFGGYSKQDSKKEAQVRSFFGIHFKKKIYKDCKEDIIGAIVSGKTKQQVHNNLMKIYTDKNTVSHIYKTIKPLIKDLPGN